MLYYIRRRKSMKNKTDKYIILGHENPDIDSIVSGYLLEKLMCKMGYDAEFIIPDSKIDLENITICGEYGLNPCSYQKKLPNTKEYKVILVDHYNRNVEGEIVGVIDHHPTTSNIETFYYQNENASSTSCLICTEENEKYFSKEDMQLAILAAMVDTASFHSTKTRKQDIDWAKKTCMKYQLDYEKIYKTGLCLTDISNIKTACYNGLKKYCFYGYNVESSYIQIEDITKISDLVMEMIDLLKEHVQTENIEVFSFIVHDMTQFKTVVYDITCNGYSIRNYEKYTSRGNTIIPEIEKKLKNDSMLKIFIGSSSRDTIDHKYLEEAREISQILSKDNCALVFGAASFGMMGACYQEFHSQHQPIHSYTVEKYEKDLAQLQSDVEIVLPTTFDRTKQLYQDADMIILLPGGTGTIAEIFGILEENRTIDSPKKVVLYNFNGYYDKLLELVHYCVNEKFNDSSIYDYFMIANTREEVLSFISYNRYQKRFGKAVIMV